MSVSYQSDSRPHIQMRHIDGPVLWMRDGRAHWLTVWERKYWGGSHE